jgi:hypothetical protein
VTEAVIPSSFAKAVHVYVHEHEHVNVHEIPIAYFFIVVVT